ncbi:LysR substrate-binding domain-containing protein [Roseibium sp.]|uniref:LysR substrate-binding domain-containing protein n=1 Tax=Roseibium sp. TaxID=1936156 RepID=UPI003BA9D655
MKLPPLNALPAFEATVRLGSMSAAADELGRTHGAVSKQIAHLTEMAGVPLFTKQGAGVRPTEEGALLAAAVSPALEGLEAAWLDLVSKADSPVLDVGISATFAMRWLMPRMSRFYQRHPEAQVNFKMTGRFRIPDSEVDLILTWDRLRWDFAGRTDIVALGDVAFGIVHAPGLDVKLDGWCITAPCRCVQELPGDVWGEYAARTGVTVNSVSTLAYPHTFLVIEAALAGFGVALVEKRLVEEELVDGRLIAPFGFYEIPGGFGAIFPERSRTRKLPRAFLDWLKDEEYPPS